jgi:hypothetical protein
MISAFNIEDVDFMGYSVDKSTANYHHLIIPRRNGGAKTINNGAILNKDTSHPYLHIVESKDYDMFYNITKQMMIENKLGRLDIDCFKRINDILLVFEREHSSDINFLNEPLIKEEYTKRLYK